MLRRKLKRSQFLPFFAKLAPTVIGLEACGSSHHWARELMALGHEVKLVPAQYVKAYVKRSKKRRARRGGRLRGDEPADDALRAGEERRDPGGLMVASMRERLTRERTRLANTIRGHGAEFGLTAPKGLAHIAPLLAEAAGAEAVPELAP